MRRGVALSAVLALGLLLSSLVSEAPAGAAKPPLHIAVMGIYAGAFAAPPGSDNPLKLAVAQVNKAGGILGRKVEFKEFDTNITPQGAVTGTQLAMQYNPDVVIGYGVSAGLQASSTLLNQKGVLLIHGTLDPKLTSPTALHSDLTFRMGPTVGQFAGAADRFLFQSLKVKKLMVINTQDSAPTDGGNTILDQAKTAGIQTDHRSISPVASDVTEPILAANSLGADAIWAWGYPTTDALTIKTAAANGFKGAMMTFSAYSAVASNLIPSSLLTDKIYSIPATCAPEVQNTPAAKTYVSAYTKKFGSAPSVTQGNTQYDEVMIWKAAVEKAKTFDAHKVAAALQKITYEGVCGTEKSDKNHNLVHTVTIVNFPNGKTTLAKQETNVPSEA
jgi:branched-chain amino acid transport system substrate-binding protein